MTSYEELWGVAEDWFGIVTYAKTQELGISKQCVHSMIRNGMLIKLGHGVYQVKHHVPDVDDPYAIAVAIGGPTAYLRGASVVALLNLAPTSPNAIYIGASGRVRRKLSSGYRMRDMRPCRTVEYKRITCQPVYEALKDIREEGVLDADRVAEAATEAYEKGLITNEENAEFQG